MNFWIYGLSPTTFLSLFFSSLRRLALAPLSSPLPVLGNSVLIKHNQPLFSSVVMSRVRLSYQKLVEGSCHSRRTPQKTWNGRPNSPAAVEVYTGKCFSK